jgi:cell division transport system permease protein
MIEKKNKSITFRLRTSFITSIISISLVLFLLGILGLIALNANTLSRYVKENLGFSIFLKDGVKAVDMQKFQKDIGVITGVKATRFISKDEAAQILKKDLGEDFISFIGYNPLPASIDVKFYSEFTEPDSLANFEKMVLQYPMVREVTYQKSLLHLVNENLKSISFILLCFISMMLIICIALINNTIRLSVYSKRFTIKSMQLVGATRGFISGPFVLKGTINGLVGAFVALSMLSGIIFYLQNDFKKIASYVDFELLGILYLSVIFLGILITSISTYFAVNKYINIKTDNLYI